MIVDDPAPAPALVRRYVAAVRRHHPGASPREVLYLIEKQYLFALGLGGAGTGLLALRPLRALGLVGVSAGHVGASGALSAFYLLAVAHVYDLPPSAARELLSRCSFGEHPGGILQQQLGLTDSWWATALAYLPASQVRFVERVADRQLRRAAARGGLSWGASGVPAGIATTLGGASGRIFGRRVLAAAVEFLGDPPAQFAGRA